MRMLVVFLVCLLPIALTGCEGSSGVFEFTLVQRFRLTLVDDSSSFSIGVSPSTDAAVAGSVSSSVESPKFEWFTGTLLPLRFPVLYSDFESSYEFSSYSGEYVWYKSEKRFPLVSSWTVSKLATPDSVYDYVTDIMWDVLMLSSAVSEKDLGGSLEYLSVRGQVRKAVRGARGEFCRVSVGASDIVWELSTDVALCGYKGVLLSAYSSNLASQKFSVALFPVGTVYYLLVCIDMAPLGFADSADYLRFIVENTYFTRNYSPAFSEAVSVDAYDTNALYSFYKTATWLPYTLSLDAFILGDTDSLGGFENLVRGIDPYRSTGFRVWYKSGDLIGWHDISMTIHSSFLADAAAVGAEVLYSSNAITAEDSPVYRREALGGWVCDYAVTERNGVFVGVYVCARQLNETMVAVYVLETHMPSVAFDFDFNMELLTAVLNASIPH